MNALVTGGAGFVGQWLCRALVARGWSVWATRVHGDFVPGAPPGDALAAVHWVDCDVTRVADLRAALDASAPEAIFHLAGISFVPAAGADPGAAVEVNVVGAARLVGEVRTRRRAGTLDPVVLVVGSGEQYGRHGDEEQPLPESAAQLPLTVYAASKAAQEVVALEAHRSDGVRVIAARSFNHSGPGQSDRFLVPALVARALRLRGERGAVLRVGNTTPVRDFLHVADVVDAYIRLAAQGVPGEAYNVASGRGTDVATLAARVLALAGCDAKLQIDPTLVRPVDVPVLVGDAAKLRAATGWAPEHTLDSIIEDLIRATTR
jgi:GDP-4-dehydro-6-deoxy-D-mannose reductase